jgi:hypothetical protein
LMEIKMATLVKVKKSTRVSCTGSIGVDLFKQVDFK